MKFKIKEVSIGLQQIFRLYIETDEEGTKTIDIWGG